MGIESILEKKQKKTMLFLHSTPIHPVKKQEVVFLPSPLKEACASPEASVESDPKVTPATKAKDTARLIMEAMNNHR